jgi:hypothetical protein
VIDSTADVDLETAEIAQGMSIDDAEPSASGCIIEQRIRATAKVAVANPSSSRQSTNQSSS